MKLIFVTQNQGKIKEMRDLLADFDVEVMSAKEAGVAEDVEEDQDTFEGNSLKKARFVSQKTGEWAVADDSGICIKELNCRPGVMTARWAGEGAGDEDLVSHTLKEMKDIPEGRRQAWFESAVALVSPDGGEWTFVGKVDGRVPLEPKGTPRLKLPYDVIFIPEDHDRTFAEMSDAEKNSMSHRGLAFQKLKDFLRNQSTNQPINQLTN